MAGIYVHIPFCRRACHYCDFHFTTNLKRTSELVDALVTEINLRADYLKNEPVKTIYFGGGTPSLLPTKDIERILVELHKTQSVASEIELTLEANPEDLSVDKLNELMSIGINRLSLGTQSFIDLELKWMNRMHTSDQARRCISDAQSIGFENISIDLIFGLPEQSEEDWRINLNTAIELNIQHISSYGLTVEEKTVLNHRIQKGEQQPPDETASARYFEMNMDFFPEHGFEHYEISNFARQGHISKHNSSYWRGENYLGIGPSAHSFNGVSRQWNVKSNAAYIQKLNEEGAFIELENLSVTDKINEQIMIGLRTKWGIQKTVLEHLDADAWNTIVREAEVLNSKDIDISTDKITLTKSGKLKADLIASQLFI